MVRVDAPMASLQVNSPVVNSPQTTTESPAPVQMQVEAEEEHDVESEYSSKRDALLQAADGTSGHLNSLTEYLGQGPGPKSWPLHYPTQLALNAAGDQAPSPRTMRRSYTSAAPQHPAATFTPSDSSISEEPTARPTPMRSSTVVRNSVPSSGTATPTQDSHPLSILDIDLKIGSHSNASSVAFTPSMVGDKMLTELFVKRLRNALQRMHQIRTRTADTTSRILVSGDVNAGKSTFVNAILRKPYLMPTDQQPLTEVFTEVTDARENGGKVEIHAIKRSAGESYDATNSDTYDRYEVDDLTDIVARGSEYSHAKVYIDDVSGGENENGESLLRNDAVSISLIDGPGLNVDSLQSTAVFSRESEIDVVVFIVSAENHFTLSGREFLLEAAREKAYVFIVVNKWAGIRDKAKCARNVGEQIRLLSPATWEERDELVHYVDSEGAWKTDDLSDSEPNAAAFQHLERSLRSFVLRRREKSKLAPAKVYMDNLLTDLIIMADYNYQAAVTEIDNASVKLETLRPAHEKLIKQRSKIEDALEHVEESTIERVAGGSARRAKRALEYIANGSVIPPEFAAENGIALAPISAPGAPLALPAYPGIWHVAEWYSELQDSLKRSLHGELCLAEDYARKETKQAVLHIMEEIPKQFLPEDALAKKERTFNDAAMYEKSRRKRVTRLGIFEINPVDGNVGTGAVGLRAQSKSKPHFEFSFVDLIDTESLMELPGRLAGSGKRRIGNGDLLESGNAMSVFSLSFGAVAMLGSRIAGVHNLVDSVTRTITFLGSKEMQRLLAPAAVIAFVGGSAYVVYNIPRSVPRNVGRRLVAEMEAQAHSSSPLSPRYQLDGQSFATHFGQQVSAESRKCIRYASFQTKEMHRMAEEEVAKEREGAEQDLAKAESGKAFFSELGEKVAVTKAEVNAVDLSG